MQVKGEGILDGKGYIKKKKANQTKQNKRKQTAKIKEPWVQVKGRTRVRAWSDKKKHKQTKQSKTNKKK